MAGAGLDEGVGNLERFIEGLQRASAQLGETTSGLESAGGDLERLEGESQDTIGGLTDDLEEGADAVQQALDDTREAVEEVGDTAQEGADGRLSDAQESLEESAGECEEQLSQGQAALDERFARLSESGYDAYGSALEEATNETNQADGANREAFDGLEESVDEGQGRLDAASAEAVDALEEAASETEGAGRELDDAFTTVTAEWKESIDNQLREGCQDAGEALASAYGSWGDEASSVADSLGEQVDEVLTQAAEFLGADSSTALEEAREAGLDEPGGDLMERFDDTSQSLEAGEGLAQALEAVAPDLQKSLDVVDQVDRLLKALE